MEGEIAVITRQEAEEADYNLSPSRWAGNSEAEELGSIASMVGELERLNSLDIQTTSRLMVFAAARCSGAGKWLNGPLKRSRTAFPAFRWED